MTQLLENSSTANAHSLDELAFALNYSRGEFKLVFVRCNFLQLRSRLMAQLQERLDFAIANLTLDESATTLFDPIREAISENQPAAVSICGLETVREIDRLLEATNKVREEFRKAFHFPLVLWVDDEILSKLICLVPDFESWGTVYEFSISEGELLATIAHYCDRVYDAILGRNPSGWICGTELLADGDRKELLATLNAIGSSNINIEDRREAEIEFLFGQIEYRQDNIEAAIEHYDRSVELFQSIENPDTSTLAKQSLSVSMLGFCQMRLADLYPASNRQHWQQAKHYIAGSIDILKSIERWDLVSRSISFYGEVLSYLENWTELEAIAKEGLSLHQTYGSLLQLASDYGFLAFIYRNSCQWEKVRESAAKALEVLNDASGSISDLERSYRIILANLYRLLLVEALQHLGQKRYARKYLNFTRQSLLDVLKSEGYRYSPYRYIRILNWLRSLYFQQGCYLEAFWIRQKRRSIEQQYGLRAFIGAGRLELSLETGETIATEIVASGRERDLDRLLARVGRPDCKLTIVHGQSGVGKSSIVRAGLLPALQHKSLGMRDIASAIVQTYTNWDGAIAAQILDEEGDSKIGRHNREVRIDRILEKLKANADREFISVLIFDQFEEFFVTNERSEEREPFYRFFQECLQLPYVKLILSLREDYLHEILECERLLGINSDLLNRSIRYYLGNFSKTDAAHLIQCLTERSHFHLEPELIAELTNDLAGEFGEVRPVELQIVGAQLQAENISTLQQYKECGPKIKLVERFLQSAIEDCGPENAVLAWQVLFCLTAEDDTRPLKTYNELALEIGVNGKRLELVLEILHQSGLLSLLPEFPANRYQLVHDYLVSFIRQQQDRSRRRETEVLRRLNHRLNASKRSLIAALTASFLAVGMFGGLSVHARKQTELARSQQQRAMAAELEAAIAEIDARNSASQAFLLSNNQLEALLASVKAGGKLQQIRASLDDRRTLDALKYQTLTRLQQTAYFTTERNRLQGHSNSVLNVRYSPDGKFIATASADRTVKLWQPDGSFVSILSGHQGGVTRVAFSPGGQLIATASADNTVKLWQPDGTLIRSFMGHEDTVTSLSFSRDGQFLATASADKTIKLWQLNGRLIGTLKGHEDWVMGIAFSPDGQTIASVSRDRSLRLWNTQGKLLKTLRGHADGLTAIAWSPDGETLVTTSADRTVKLWSATGQLLRTLGGHRDWVLAVNFSRDGEVFATASADRTVRLWRKDGTLIRILEGHADRVWSVSFSPDGQTIATASADNTVKLWHRYSRGLPSLDSNNAVLAVSPSDRQEIATASEDGSISIWNRDRVLQHRWQAHESATNWVGFSGKILASAGADSTLKLWDSSGKLLRVFEHPSGVTSASWSADENIIVTATTDAEAFVWTANGQHLATLIGHEGAVTGTAIAADNTIATASEDGTIKLWQANGQPLQTFTGHEGAINWIAFSPDSQILASASGDNTLILWQRNGDRLAMLEGHTGPANWVAFSASGDRVASASDDGTVRLWNRQGELLATFSGHDNAVFSLSFSRDDRWIISSDRAGKVLFWNLDLDNLLDLSCDWLHDYLKTNPQVNMSDRMLCQPHSLEN